MEHWEILEHDILSLIDDGDHQAAIDRLAQNSPEFAASIIDKLRDEDKTEIFYRLPVEFASLVIADLTDESAHHLIDELYDETLINFLTTMPTDEAVDLLGIVPDDQAERVLGRLPENIKRLFAHPEDSAGGIMEAEYLSMPAGITVAKARSFLKLYPRPLDEVYQIFLVDGNGRLTGIVPIHRLLVTESTERLRDISDTLNVVARIDQDQEDVAQLFRQNNLVSAPVVDAEDRLRGRITIDDIVDVLDDEATEDSYRMVGLGPEEYSPSSIHLVSQRVPWLAVSLGAEIVSGFILQHFSETLSTFVILASFIPLIMAMGGNVGVQSATVVIRRLALGHLEGENRKVTLIKELLAGLMLGVIFGICLFIVGIVWGNYRAGYVAAISIFSAMALSTSVGCFFPLLLKKAGRDPAFATGPFITAFNDVCGLFIYLFIATRLL